MLSSPGTTRRTPGGGLATAEGAAATGTGGAGPRAARLPEVASATATSHSGTGLAPGRPPPGWGDDTAGSGRARRRSSPTAVAECAPPRGADPPLAKVDRRQAAPDAEAVYARGASDRRRSPKHAPAARGGRRSRPDRAGRDARAQPAGASRGAIHSRSGRGGRGTGSRAWGGAGPSRARNGAEAGGLRTALDGQRTAVATPRGGGGQNSSRVELRPDGRCGNGFISGRSDRAW